MMLVGENGGQKRLLPSVISISGHSYTLMSNWLVIIQSKKCRWFIEFQGKGFQSGYVQCEFKVL